MVDASAGGALMNKMPEEAWELIESMADNNQHFKVRATSAAKGVFEVTPSKSTILAKSLVDIADKCPQLQEDQIIAASHNFYDNQQSSPNNRQYYPQPQGWRDNQQNRWNPPQQPQQNQFRQPYTYNQPQNPQNQRYQPPHTRQIYHPPNVPPPNYEETLCAYQQESREMKENQKKA
ncbi:hypothetical protein PIB30_105019 [Stylosanthes scabra]|uniref:Uncharacterized protein n=1 Tax=Stylosanthes scabra TaxID=79078 RepID=A0ABU6Y0T6_9FABA|nr:hypothetical protein [Stylosanthes scabra]